MKRIQEVSEGEELYLARILHTILNACPANTHEIDAMQVRPRFFLTFWIFSLFCASCIVQLAAYKGADPAENDLPVLFDKLRLRTHISA